MKFVIYSIVVPNMVYWITFFVICEVFKMDSLVGAIVGSAATIFVGILGLIGVCISNGRKSKKLNDNLVKLQDCQIGVKDGELSIANRLGVTNGEETNLTAQNKILREDHKDIKIILNEEIKKSIKKRFIDNKHQFNCVYEYVRNTADEVDKKTAVMFCDYVIDILCKNIESNMQLNFAEDYRFCLIYEIAKFKYGLEHE